jgi:uracil-DNA glycosylase family 4
MNSELSELRDSLKTILKENEGELGYWGEPMAAAPSIATAVPVSVESRSQKLLRLNTETIGDCHKCPLGDTRTKLVFGVGNPDSGVMIIGEGPGFDEDRLGDPFVGKAGQLLDKILVAIQLDRTKVYIANIVKCHPMIDPSQPEKRGNDRPPTPEEMAECLPFLKEQIRIVAPKIVVALGATSAKALLGRQVSITAIRGKLTTLGLGEEFGSIPLLPTFHPAALLRDPDLKKPVWEDMKFLRDWLAQR